MAVTPRSSSHLSSFGSSTIKQVYLYDWWLARADTSSDSPRLSIGGIHSDERLGTRVFHSAAIVRRHNTVTLETSDGIVVNILGSINKSRTIQNGFPLEVCNHFIFGFPYYWEEFATEISREDSTDRAIPSGLPNLNGIAAPVNGASAFSLKSFDDLPGAFLRGFSSSTLGGDSTVYELTKSMFEDMLQKYGNSINNGGLLYPENNKGGQAMNTEEEGSSKGEKTVGQQNRKGPDDLSGRRSKRKNFQETTLDERVGFEANTLRMGPLTRSMAHLKDSVSKKKENAFKKKRKNKKRFCDLPRSVVTRSRASQL